LSHSTSPLFLTSALISYLRNSCVNQGHKDLCLTFFHEFNSLIHLGHWSINLCICVKFIHMQLQSFAYEYPDVSTLFVKKLVFSPIGLLWQTS
jgi:hypothetical protein